MGDDGHLCRRAEDCVKKLLVTSDDFGMTLSVNRGIEKAMLAGVVRSSNLMVPCPWFQDAAIRTKTNKLKVGLHLTVTCEWDRYRWRPLTDSSSLRAEDGGMHREYAELPPSLRDEEVFAEYAAQLAELHRVGIRPTHVDTHMLASASARPIDLRIKQIVERFCAVERLRYTYAVDDGGSLRHFDSELLFSPEPEEGLVPWLEKLAAGTHHLIVHCGEDGEDLDGLCRPEHAARPWAREYRVKDLKVLLGGSFGKTLRERSIQLIDVAELA